MDQKAPEFCSFPGYPKKPKRTAVILAGGEGSRLQSLTRTITGDDRPKQFCPLIGDRTLLDATRERIRSRIAPENTYFKEDRVKQVVGVKLRLKGGAGSAKPGMPADARIVVAART